MKIVLIYFIKLYLFSCYMKLENCYGLKWMNKKINNICFVKVKKIVLFKMVFKIINVLNKVFYFCVNL